MKSAPGKPLRELLGLLQAELLTGSPTVSVTGCYISDLLSDVLAHARTGMLWVTVQTHRNVLSVAALNDVEAVLLSGGHAPEPAIIAEAAEQHLTILTTPLTTYEAAGRLWEAGLRGAT